MPDHASAPETWGNPAIVVHPTRDGRAALAQAVSKALGGAHVTLEEDALAQEAALVIDQSQLRRDQVVVLGQDPGTSDQPERFHRVKIRDRVSWSTSAPSATSS